MAKEHFIGNGILEKWQFFGQHIFIYIHDI